jgi:peptidoglycan/LPS O-acetylase OafA/YrhL
MTASKSATLTQPDMAGSSSLQRAGGTFRPDIEGLRAIAVLAVVLFHAGVPGVGGGYIGVDVFFVISGFLITGLLWREVASSGSVRLLRFYAARARRLLPASAIVGVATAVSSAVLLDPLEARHVLLDAVSCALYVGNYGFAMQGTDYLSAAVPPSPFQHYWSLGVEEQFYLVWAPLILGVAWLSRRASRRTWTDVLRRFPYLIVLALVGLTSFATSLVLTQAAPSWAFFSLPTRAWELAAGGLIALTVDYWSRLPAAVTAVAGWAGVSLILLGCHLLGTNTQYPGTAALIPVAGTASVLAAGCAAAPFGIGRVLSIPPLRAIGRMSYSWYLWHWPVLLLAPHLLGHQLNLAARLTAAGISGSLAVLTLYGIENPLRFSSSIRGSVGRSLALGGGATAIALSSGLVLLLLVPTPVGRGPAAPEMKVTASTPPSGSALDVDEAAVRDAYAQVRAAVAASAGVHAVPSNLNPPLAGASDDRGAILVNGCLRAYDEVDQGECATGDILSALTIALVGDSHATTWSPAFREEAERRHWKLETLGKEACPLIDLPLSYPRLRREYSECGQWRARILDRLQREHPQLVVLSMNRLYGAGYGFTPYDATWLHGLALTVKRLHANGAKVLVLGPVPDPHSIVPACLSAHLDDATACSPPRSTAVNRSGIAAEAAATEASGGRYADMTDLFCAADRCPAAIGNTLVYRDDNHVTMQYTRLLGPVLGALVDRTLADGTSKHE